MFFTEQSKLTRTEIVKLIEDARNAEICRDIRASQKILGRVWESFDSEPQIENLEMMFKADVLRLCGFLLSYYGRSRSLKNYQERGKNFLTRAIDIFEECELLDKAAESKVILALCYWYEGSVEECAVILDKVEQEYKNDQLHPVYIQICVNRMMIHFYKQEFDKALFYIENLKVPVEYCKDNRLITMYHNQSGACYQFSNQNENALLHYSEAIKFARRGDNKRFCAIAYNNLGNVYKNLGKFDLAHASTDEAIKYYTKIDEPGWLAHFFDTKALIYLAEGKLEKSLEKIEESLDIFRKGEDFVGLADALFNKSQILVRKNNLAIALTFLVEAVTIANIRIGEFAGRRYLDKFSQLVYPYKFLPYQTEVKSFKAALLDKNLRETNLQITKAAERLGISHQSLSDILINQFPELADELGIRQRAPRGTGRRPKTKKQKHANNFLSRITPLEISVQEITTIGGLKLKEIPYLTFVMNSTQLPSKPFQGQLDIIVLVEAVEEITGGLTVILQNLETKDFVCGDLQIDEWTNIPFLQTSFADVPILLDDFRYFGKIVGYCNLSDAAEGNVCFQPYSI